MQNLSEKIKTISVGVSLLITLAGVVISLVNYFTLNQLAPFGNRINVIEKTLRANEADQSDFRKTVATKEQVDSISRMMDGRLKNIEDKLEYIYRLHIGK